MKRIVAVLLAATMAFSCMACGKDAKSNQTDQTNETEQGTADEPVVVQAATTILNDIWEAYPGEKFSVAGGDYDNMTEGQAGALDYTNAETLDSILAVPAEGKDLIGDAASLMHALNANTFTAGAMYLTYATETAKLADMIYDNVMSRQWICGFPDTLIIASVGDEYLVSAFGEAEIMENFKTALTAAYSAEILYEESLSE